MMEAVSASETSVNICQTTQRYVSEDNHLNFSLSISQSKRTQMPVLPYNTSGVDSKNITSTHQSFSFNA
jgi:hypothetical protein